MGVPDEVSLALTGVSWGLEWTGVQSDPAGWSVTNNVGVRFEVRSGWLLDYSVTLVRCPEQVADAGFPWLSVLGIGSAHAGHEGYDDPSEVQAQWGEELSSLPDGNLGVRSFPSDRYCGVHWLVARADQGVLSADGTDLSGISLSAQGSWSIGDESGELAIRSEFTQGVVLPFPPDVLDAAAEDSFAEVSISRSAAGMFDGLDPRTMNEYALAWAVLQNLADQAQLRVALREPPGGVRAATTAP